MNFGFLRTLEQISDIIGSHFQFSSVQKVQNFAHNLKFEIVNFDDFWSIFCEYFSKFQTVSCEEKDRIKLDENLEKEDFKTYRSKLLCVPSKFSHLEIPGRCRHRFPSASHNFSGAQKRP
jgi:hypothetical protein